MSGIDLEDFLNTHGQLAAAVAGLSEEQLKWKPSPQVWSVQEVVSHLVDHSFVISFRIRDILAGTSAQLPAFNQDAWVSGQHSNEGRISDILDAFHAILEYNSLLVGRLNEEELEKTGVNFKGETVSIKAIIQGFTRHIHGHLGQIERINQAAETSISITLYFWAYIRIFPMRRMKIWQSKSS